MERPSS